MNNDAFWSHVQLVASLEHKGITREIVHIRSLYVGIALFQPLTSPAFIIKKAGNKAFVGMVQNTLSNNYALIKLPVLQTPWPHSHLSLQNANNVIVNASFQCSQCRRAWERG